MAVSRGKPLHYIVEVHGSDSQGKATYALISHHATPDSGIRSIIGILEQWAASHGAVKPGTSVRLKDTRDGGSVVTLDYLGYELDTLIGR